MSNNSTDLTQLVFDAKNRDSSAQRELIELTQNRLLKFCILLGSNKELAEDICQEAYIKAFTNLDKLDSANSFYSWLCQIAKNLFFDYKRKNKEKLLATEEQADQDHSDFLKGEYSTPQYESIIQVQKVLNSFEYEDRFIILMIELEGLTYLETANLLKKTEDTIRSKLHRLRQEFIKKLKK